MPEMARRALDGHHPPPVSASSPYVTEPPGLGVLAAEAPGAVVTRNAVALASVSASAATLVRMRLENGAELMCSDPPGYAHPKVTGRYPNPPWPNPVRATRANPPLNVPQSVVVCG